MTRGPSFGATDFPLTPRDSGIARPAPGHCRSSPRNRRPIVPLAGAPIFRHARPINKTLWEDATMQDDLMYDDLRAPISQAQTSRRRFMASAVATLVVGAAGRMPAFAQSPSRTLIKGGV